MISRRPLLQLALVSPALAALAAARKSLFDAPSRVVPSIDGADVSRIKVLRGAIRASVGL